KDASIQPQYAHQVSITENQSVVSNVVPASTLAHITVYFEGGRRFEHEKNAGMTQLLMMCMLNGSEEKRKIKEKLENSGVRIEIENSADFFGLHFSVHPTLVEKVIPIIAKLIYHTEFTENFINEQKLLLLKDQSAKLQEPFFRSVELFYQSLFGVHGYGQPRLGTAFSVLHIEPKHLAYAYTQDIAQSNSTLWIVTSPKKHEDIPLLVSQHIPKNEKTIEARAQLFSMFPKKQIKVTKDTHSENLHSVCMGLKTISIKDPRQHYLEIMQIYLSGSGGVLSDALVEKLNLVDTVKAYHVHLLQAGVFFIQLKSKQVQDASLFEYLQTIFTSLTKISPSHDALDIAKELAIMGKKHRLQHARELSYDIGSRYFAGLPWEEPRLIEQNIRKTQSDELTGMMGDVMDFDSFAMGIC
ncbi:MAG: insulinase family protein, partial [Bdellovibrionales bacterium]|nr:insulinase family protein [Bdellovibrionales bacterium]